MYALLPLPPGTSSSGVPPSSLYWIQKSASRSSSRRYEPEQCRVSTGKATACFCRPDAGQQPRADGSGSDGEGRVKKERRLIDLFLKV